MKLLRSAIGGVTDDNQDARQTVVTLGRAMRDAGLTRGTGGNVSVRVGDRLAISPTGADYDEIDPASVPVTDLTGEVIRDTDPGPSSELPMHRAAYDARPDAGCVLHTHSPYATAFATAREPIPPSHYLLASVGPEVPVAGYDRPGSEGLADRAAKRLDTEHDAVLLANHGVLVVGPDGETALESAAIVEYCAKVHHHASAIGEPVVLDGAAVAELEDALTAYRSG